MAPQQPPSPSSSASTSSGGPRTPLPPPRRLPAINESPPSSPSHRRLAFFTSPFSMSASSRLRRLSPPSLKPTGLPTLTPPRPLLSQRDTPVAGGDDNSQHQSSSPRSGPPADEHRLPRSSGTFGPSDSPASPNEERPTAAERGLNEESERSSSATGGVGGGGGGGGLGGGAVSEGGDQVRHPALAARASLGNPNELLASVPPRSRSSSGGERAVDGRSRLGLPLDPGPRTPGQQQRSVSDGIHISAPSRSGTFGAEGNQRELLTTNSPKSDYELRSSSSVVSISSPSRALSPATIISLTPVKSPSIDTNSILPLIRPELHHSTSTHTLFHTPREGSHELPFEDAASSRNLLFEDASSSRGLPFEDTIGVRRVSSRSSMAVAAASEREPALILRPGTPENIENVSLLSFVGSPSEVRLSFIAHKPF